MPRDRDTPAKEVWTRPELRRLELSKEQIAALFGGRMSGGRPPRTARG